MIGTRIGAYEIVAKVGEGKPQTWSEVTFSSFAPISTYGLGVDIHPDGKRFAVAPPVARAALVAPTPVVLIFNFFDELRKRSS